MTWGMKYVWGEGKQAGCVMSFFQIFVRKENELRKGGKKVLKQKKE